MHLPAEITSLLRDPSTKAAWLSEHVPNHECQNCGGARVISAFIATEGPYDTPAGPYLTRGKDAAGNDIHLSSHAEVINGRTRWWVGRVFAFPCPDCQNQLAPAGNTPKAHYQRQGQFDMTVMP